HGYKIGTVREIEFHPHKPGRFIVSVALEKDIPIVEDSRAEIYSSDLMGTKAIQFIDGNSNVNLQPGDTVNSQVSGGLKEQITTELSPLKEKIEAMVVELDSTLSGMSGVFSNENNQSLEEGMKSFRMMMMNLENSSLQLNEALADGGSIHNSMANIDSVSQDLNRQRESVSSTIENLSVVSEQLKAMNLDTLGGRIDSGLVVINDILEKTKEGDGSLGLLLSNEGLYYNMLDASANLDRLLADLRHNPKRYLNLSAFNFGREVYIKVDDEEAEQQGIVYKVKINESKEPLDIKNQLIADKYRIFEDTNGKNYTYTVGETTSYATANRIKEEVLRHYNDAEIIAFEEGKRISVKKALKKTGVKN
ncbi:MAG: MlaD family protein, partial [Bacteroidota bacterium]